MSDGAPAYNLAAIRQLLTAAFTPKELRRFCLDRSLLRPVVDRFGPDHGLDDMVDEVVAYCETELLWDDLLAIMAEAKPRQYARFEPQLRASQPPAAPSPPLSSPAAVATYLEVVRRQCGLVETRPYRQLSELRGAPPRLSLLGEAGREGVYVPLRFDLHPSPGRAGPQARLPGEAGLEGEGRQMPAERDLARVDVSLAEALAAPGHVVLIGAAGCGKTTVLRLAAAVLAEQDPALARAELGLDAGLLPLPVYVALRDFEHACQAGPQACRR
ncbi:MAG: hypothetical protein JXM73_16610, partial [Anaerolineae bacterium]|nr:hypothetical protein [Anaerolineae bacterium]